MASSSTNQSCGLSSHREPWLELFEYIVADVVSEATSAIALREVGRHVGADERHGLPAASCSHPCAQDDDLEPLASGASDEECSSNSANESHQEQDESVSDTTPPGPQFARSAIATKKPFNCPICHKVLSYNRGRSHIELQHKKNWVDYSPTALRCYWCPQRCCNTNAHREHAAGAHLVDGYFTCPRLACASRFRTWKHLLLHFERTHPTPADKCSCPVCGMVVPHKIRLHNHMRVHSTEFKYECTDCGQKFKYGPSLLEHTKNFHDAAKPSAHVKRQVKFPDGITAPRSTADYMASTYKCLPCKLGFRMRKQLVLHLNARHPDQPASAIPEMSVPVIETRQLGCPSCRRFLQTKQGLTEHVERFHPGALVVEDVDGVVKVDGKAVQIKSIFLPWCVQCDMKFISAARLLTHNNYWHSETGTRENSKP